MTNLRNIPGVGPKTVDDLKKLRIYTIEDLALADPYELYERECAQKGVIIDRCQLYVYRYAVYYAKNGHHKEQLRWWDFKDKE